MPVFPRMANTDTVVNHENDCNQQSLLVTRQRSLRQRSLRQQGADQGRTVQLKYVASSLIGLVLTFTLVTATFAQSCQPYTSPHQRIGFNVAPDNGKSIDDYNAALLGAGWYHNYGSRLNPSRPGGIQYHHMVRSSIDQTNLPELLENKIRKNPGAMWILGNEPDRYGQDGLTPVQYAKFYHNIYTYIRSIDPTSQIAIAGIVQPTPIRLRYLDMVLSSYQQLYGEPMPVEIWDIHNFILPEDCGWGASIPPGLEGYRAEAIPCPPTLDDHGDINIFKAQIRTFRQWMKARGFQNTPLIISEYGILLSKYHGYDYARVRNYMIGTFDYMLHTTDAQLGYPADGNRLVQEFAWFSLNYWEFDIKTYFGLNGNLFDHDSAQLMPLGNDFAAYTQSHTLRTIDLAFLAFEPLAAEAVVNQPNTVAATFMNYGGIQAEQVTLQLWNGDPNAGGTLIGSTDPLPALSPGCKAAQQIEVQWTPTQGGLHTIFGRLTAANQQFEVDLDSNLVAIAIPVVDIHAPTATPTLIATTPTATPDPNLPTATATFAPTAPTATPTLVPTAVTPTPTTVPTSSTTALIDPGQTTTMKIATANGTLLKVTFPAGTVNEALTIVFRALESLPTGERALSYEGIAFQIEALRNGTPLETFKLATPILLTVDYLDNNLGEQGENAIMLYAYDSNANQWQKETITLISHNLDANQLALSYSDGSRASGAIRTFALFSEAETTPTPTPTPTLTSDPTVTPTPVAPTGVYQLYLPLIEH